MIRHPRPVVARHGKRVSFRRPTDAGVEPRRAAHPDTSTSSPQPPTHPATPERT